jgi:uncharacterized DUF497 family protein
MVPGFEWDEDKAIANFRKHGVTFEEAAEAITDPASLAWIDERDDYDEERWMLLGMSQSRILFVAYTERGDDIRVISARKAERHEQEIYYRQEAP